MAINDVQRAKKKAGQRTDFISQAMSPNEMPQWDSIEAKNPKKTFGGPVSPWSKADTAGGTYRSEGPDRPPSDPRLKLDWRRGFNPVWYSPKPEPPTTPPPPGPPPGQQGWEEVRDWVGGNLLDILGEHGVDQEVLDNITEQGVDDALDRITGNWGGWFGLSDDEEEEARDRIEDALGRDDLSPPIRKRLQDFLDGLPPKKQ